MNNERLKAIEPMLPSGSKALRVIEWRGNEAREVFPEVIYMDMEDQQQAIRRRRRNAFWDALEREWPRYLMEGGFVLMVLGVAFGIWLSIHHWPK